VTFIPPVICGATLIANVEPVPVCEATDVALPTLVMGPVRLALVVTVSASAARAAYRLATCVAEATTNGAVPVASVLVSCPLRPTVVSPAIAPADVSVAAPPAMDPPLVESK
jgi:hypothetical protein